MKGQEFLRRSRSRRLAEGIIEHLTEQIRNGSLAAGDRLPSERNLSHTLGVSRTVVREALMYMQQAGLVHSRRGSGTYVADGVGSSGSSFSSVRSSIQFGSEADRSPGRSSRSGLTQQQVVWLFELRMGIETEAAALAAARADEQKRAQIVTALDRFADRASKQMLGVEADFEFHRAIVEASDNPYLSDIFSAIGDRLVQSVTLSRVRTTASADGSALVEREHRTIYEHIAAGDARHSRRAMRLHLEAAFERLGLPKASAPKRPDNERASET